MKKRFSEEQIIRFLKEIDAGIPVTELCRPRSMLGYMTPAEMARQLGDQVA